MTDPKQIQRTLPYGGILHEVVAYGGVLYLGGIVAEDIGQDMYGQAKDVLAQLVRLIEDHGSDRSRVLQVTVFMKDLGEKPDFNRAWKECFPALHLPARAVVGVADLGDGVRLEMTAMAALA